MGVGRVDYVLDANVVISILISGKSYHREVLSNLNCYSIDFIYEEISKYEAVILSKAKLSEENLQRFIFAIFRTITVVPSFAVNPTDWQWATEICAGIDTKDVAYVALSKAAGFPLVTRDKFLHTGLRRKGFRNVLLFSELIELL